jgi:hypothetical protein
VVDVVLNTVVELSTLRREHEMEKNRLEEQLRTFNVASVETNSESVKVKKGEKARELAEFEVLHLSFFCLVLLSRSSFLVLLSRSSVSFFCLVLLSRSSVSLFCLVLTSVLF